MAGNVHLAARKGREAEKITINLGYVDLGRIDLLVQEGFYSNRTDFIRTAIRNQLAAHSDAVKNRSSGTRSNSDCGTTAERISRRSKPPAKCCNQGGWTCPYRAGRHARTRALYNRVDQRPRRSAGQRAVKSALADRIR